MTTPHIKPARYPKTHLLAASGVAALLSLALLVFPSREVEAKKTYLSLELGSAGAQSNSDEQDTLRPSSNPDDDITSPFSNFDDSAKNRNFTNQDADQKQDNPLQQTTTISIDPSQQSVTVGNGDTLSVLFNRVGLSSTDLHTALNSSKEAKRFANLKVGQVLDFKLTPEGTLDAMSSKLSSLESIHLNKTAKGYSFKRELVKPDIRSAYSHGVIKSSLFLSAKRAGLSHGLTLDLANVFGYDIDFAQDIQTGDEFEVIYEEKVIEGRVINNGNILAARFTNRGKTYTAVRYTNKQGNSNYYNAQGMSMRKAFIRTPVDFARISSRFSAGRRHPILNTIRAHKGVDYAAPRGTPIKAAGNGRVLLAGRKGGYGNTVVIQHGNSYRTLYGHMQGFARGVRTGSNVKQGQVIGYIGTTGLSTGPHLHYEFMINGRAVDPMSQKLPMADPIPSSEKQRFLQLSQPLMARMDQERKTTALAMSKL